MSSLWAILKKDLRLLLADRAEMAVLFLMPLAFILPIGFAIGGGDGYGINRGNYKPGMPVVNLDGGTVSLDLVDTLSKSIQIESGFDAATVKSLGIAESGVCAKTSAACDELVARKMVEKSWRGSALIIPQGFSAAVDAGQHVSLTLLFDPAGDAVQRQQIQGVLEGATVRLSVSKQVNSGMTDMANMAALAPANLRQGLEKSASQPVQKDQPPAVALVEVQPVNIVLKKTPDTYQQTVPGYTVMYVFFLIGTISGEIKEEKYLGTFRRLLATPARPATLLAGKMLSAVLIGLFQVALLFGVGILVFHMDLGHEYLGLALLTLALVICAVSIGLAASTTQIGGILTPILIVAALLGGCLFPIDLMPPFLRTISYFVPHSWALQGYFDLMVRGQGIVQVLPQIGVLLLFSAVFFFLASRRIDLED